MADAKTTALTAATSWASGDLLYMVSDPAGTPASRKITLDNVLSKIVCAANAKAIGVTGYSLTGSDATSMIDLAGTWNTSGTPTLIKANVTDTASNASSLLMDLQVGGSSKFSLRKNGDIRNPEGFALYQGATGDLIAPVAFYPVIFNSPQRFNGSGLELKSTGYLAWKTTDANGNHSMDTILLRDAANTLALRNAANAQTFSTYGTYTDASNYRRVALSMTTAGVATLLPEGAGTGVSGNVLHISGLPTSNPGPGILWNNAGTPAIGT